MESESYHSFVVRFILLLELVGLGIGIKSSLPSHLNYLTNKYLSLLQVPLGAPALLPRKTKIPTKSDSDIIMPHAGQKQSLFIKQKGLSHALVFLMNLLE